MDKIEILIKDNKEFGDVAFLVDKRSFISAVEMLRKKWRINEPLSLKTFIEWKQKLYDERETKQTEQDNLAKLIPTDVSDIEIEVWQEKVARIMPDVDFECDVRDLRIKFNKPETFDKSISYAIVCGVIPNGVYKSTYWELESPLSPPQRLQDRTTRVAIYVTPQTELKDVENILKDIRTKLFTETKWYIPFFSLFNKNEVSKVKKYREWYWMNIDKKNKLGYRKIAQLTGENIQTVISGIRTYKNALNLP